MSGETFLRFDFALVAVKTISWSGSDGDDTAPANAVPVAGRGGDQAASVSDATGAANQAASVSDATVQKVGAAMHDLTQLEQTYKQRMQSVQNTDERRSMMQQASADAVKAVNARGVSVDQYNNVIRLAEANPSLQQRLLSAGQVTK